MTRQFAQVEIPDAPLADLCRRWKVREMSLFGSVLREDFRPDSDLDVLVVFEPGAPWSLFDLIDLQRELGLLLGRAVDLVERSALRNPFRRQSILASRKVVYAA